MGRVLVGWSLVGRLWHRSLLGVYPRWLGLELLLRALRNRGHQHRCPLLGTKRTSNRPHPFPSASSREAARETRENALDARGKVAGTLAEDVRFWHFSDIPTPH